ncbi:universal stress protein [Pseudomonas sp. F1_0610]|uniref:universal stress protein n=1 Tax=Pseudomonas sp. F1_0610 TaxID=3114284 RepID=UPI0039C461E3
MHTIKRILVVIKPNQPEGLALKRAKLIAKANNCSLHLLVCDRNNEWTAYLTDMAKALTDEGFEVTHQNAWKDSYHETIIAAQQAQDCGLVIKQHFPENPLKKALLTPDDWKLLRYCPAPVMIAKTDTSWEGGTILASVDVGNNDPEHKALHSSIVAAGLDMVNVTKGHLELFTAHPSPMLSAADPTFQLRETIETRYRKLCEDFIHGFDLKPEQMHVKEGPADILIPRMAHAQKAVLTILGTVARTGLSGALIGNTAEVVLDAIETDVLVLKPQDRIDQLKAELKK